MVGFGGGHCRSVRHSVTRSLKALLAHTQITWLAFLYRLPMFRPSRQSYNHASGVPKHVEIYYYMEATSEIQRRPPERVVAWVTD